MNQKITQLTHIICLVLMMYGQPTQAQNAQMQQYGPHLYGVSGVTVESDGRTVLTAAGSAKQLLSEIIVNAVLPTYGHLTAA